LHERIGVYSSSVYNWEGNESTPVVRFIPAIQRFLGYNPLPRAVSLGTRLRAARMSLGLSQRRLASQLGLDPATIREWEAGQH
jgi:transcriptional regulator with XRE-family HTH domain